MSQVESWGELQHPSTLSSAATLLPGQDKSSPSQPMSGVSGSVGSCGVRLFEIGFAEIRKAQVKECGYAIERSLEL
jgi:hypothetical protein